MWQYTSKKSISPRKDTDNSHISSFLFLPFSPCPFFRASRPCPASRTPSLARKWHAECRDRQHIERVPDSSSTRLGGHECPHRSRWPRVRHRCWGLHPLPLDPAVPARYGPLWTRPGGCRFFFLQVFQGQCPFHVEDIGVTVVGYSTILGEYRVLIGETFQCLEDSWGS